jgi:hypothetical protein
MRTKTQMKNGTKITGLQNNKALKRCVRIQHCISQEEGGDKNHQGELRLQRP